MRRLTLLSVLLLASLGLQSQELVRYQTPPAEMVELMEAPATPVFLLSPNGKHALLSYPQTLPDLAELAKPELKLAGFRVNPENFGRYAPRIFDKLELLNIASKMVTSVSGIPDSGQITSFSWSPDGEKVAISVYFNNSVELWLVGLEEGGVARQLAGNLNESAVSPGFTWLPDSKSLYVLKHREGMKKPDVEKLPLGPSVQQTSGQRSQVRTFQDLLKSPADEEFFEYYATSQLYRVNLLGEASEVGNPGIITQVEPSPDGSYIYVEQVVRPFSYNVPAQYFPRLCHIWRSDGHLVKRLAEQPLADDIPTGFSAVRKGRREMQWRSDVPSTIVWVEAQDDGDPHRDVRIRDVVYFLDAPYNGEPVKMVELETRFSSISWGWSNLAVVHGQWWSTRRQTAALFNPSAPTDRPRVLWDRSWEDAYTDPGKLVEASNASGFSVLQTNSSRTKLYLSGKGSSPEGDMPFLDEINLKTLRVKRLWQCHAPFYEYFIGFYDMANLRILTSRESVDMQPNFFIRDIKKEKLAQLTDFPDPYPGLHGVHKELVTYRRPDGVTLTGTLYLPAGYEKGTRTLPTLMWAYPQEFLNADFAGQVSGSPYRFIRPSALSPVLWVVRGYAVFDNMSMPIVARNGGEPNDTFAEQLVENARAAIDTLVSMGVTDRKRVAIGGHSYGAFMTANLLAHSDLFAAGIARSGAYNRTLTPFGFQNEERTYWQAPEVYNRMSPFMNADKINEPLLLIHGENDNNSGTFPLQSERLFAAIKGHGGTARLVMLPYESHGYRARQSVFHTVWEMDCWLEKYLK